MAGVVFLIFSKGTKVKTIVVLLNILLGFFLGYFFFQTNVFVYSIGFLILAGLLIYIYIKNSIPSFAVMLSAFADIVMTLAVVDILGIKVSTAGIVAFLMLIGYSVDTDILLTTRVTKKRNVDINKELWGSFKTGTTMTLTSIIAVATALIVVYGSGTILNEIFTILLIGLVFDLFNTWITNASLIKWYAESRK
jgi:preprotein translocase subunit SecF